MTKLFDLWEANPLFWQGATPAPGRWAWLPAGFPELESFPPGRHQSIHRAYLEAGCHILKTNTFRGQPAGQDGGGGLSSRRGGQSGRFHRKEAAKGFENRFVALDGAPPGKLMEPLGELSFDGAYEAFKRWRWREGAGADLCLIEP